MARSTNGGREPGAHKDRELIGASPLPRHGNPDGDPPDAAPLPSSTVNTSTPKDEEPSGPFALPLSSPTGPLSRDPRPYVPLWVKSNYSFLEGASHPDELVERAHELGLDTIALTDRNGLYGMVRAHLKAKALGLKLIVGAELTVQASPGRGSVAPTRSALTRAATQPKDWPKNLTKWGSGPTLETHHAREWHKADTNERSVGSLLLLAQDRTGYGNLCRLLTLAHKRGDKGDAWAELHEIHRHSEGLLCLCPDPRFLRALVPAFQDRLYGLLTRHLEEHEIPCEHHLRAECSHLGIKIAATIETLYHKRSRKPLADTLACMRHHCTLVSAGTRLSPNAEHALGSPSWLERLYRDCPELLAESRHIADRCHFTLDELDYRYPEEELPDGQNESSWLRELTFRGATKRYGAVIPADVRAQLNRELEIISDLRYGGYFLTMFDIVERCRSEGILCQGRGSAANSAVCYCLGITAVDPVRMDLLFERFLSRERAEPPDIDLDIEHERREEIIQWLYARYGRRRAAMVANVIRFRARSAVREVGKVLGVPAVEVDGIARLLSYFSNAGELNDDLIRQSGLDPDAPSVRMLIRLTLELVDFPRHLSIHPGGFLLGHEPVDQLVPVEAARMEGRTVIQWDKQDIEDLNLFKVDLLALGSLTAIKRSFTLIQAHYGRLLTLASVPAEDPATYEMICRGDTLGVFQIESRAQMAMLPRLKPKTFYDLVIEVAIVRPGPIQGDMVHPYLRRREGIEPVTFPHPCLERVLMKTLGVPIFQEQVMKLAVEAADYTPGEADQLRRDMAAWRSKGRIESHRERLTTRMVARGIPEDFALRVFSQIQGFGEYGFPESHAASFALLAYITAWLRRHYPAAYACALLNSQPMGFYSPSTIVEDAKRHGVPILPIDVEKSRWHCTLELVDPQVFVGGVANDHAQRGDAVTPLDGIETKHSGTGHAEPTGPSLKTESLNTRDKAPQRDESPDTAVMDTAVMGTESPNAAAPPLIPELQAILQKHRDDRKPLFGIRMGLRYVKGLGEDEGLRIESLPRPHGSLAQFARLSGFGRKSLIALAEAGAFECYGLSRRQALWQVRALAQMVRTKRVERASEPQHTEASHHGDRRRPLPAAPAFIPTEPGSPAPNLPLLSRAETVAWDYMGAHHSPLGHPMAQHRERLKKCGIPSAADLAKSEDGKGTAYVGMVICRQRPGTASGVTFYTLEDETGFVNAVVWQHVFDKHALIAKTANPLGITGRLQVAHGVTHLVADRLWPAENMLFPAPPASRSNVHPGPRSPSSSSQQSTSRSHERRPPNLPSEPQSHSHNESAGPPDEPLPFLQNVTPKSRDFH